MTGVGGDTAGGGRRSDTEEGGEGETSDRLLVRDDAYGGTHL